MIDFAEQRKNMVDSQVRPSDVTDRRIPRAMLEVRRELFVPGSQRPIAYMDDNLRVTEAADGARFLLAPRVLAKLLQHLAIGDGDAVLDIGTATGYAAAVMARLSGRVVALENDPILAERARALLAGTTVKVIEGPLATGAAADGPYDAVLINGAIAELPAALLDQLKDGGRLVACRFERGVGKATLWRRQGMRFDHRVLFDAGAPRLPGFERRAEFVL